MERKIRVSDFLEKKYRTDFRVGPISVSSLVKSSYKEVENPEINFNHSELLEKTIERREKIRIWLINNYNNCCEQIREKNKQNQAHLIFTIPECNIDESDKKYDLAASYIEEKLRSEYLDTLRIGKRKIYVSWKYLELNINNKDNNKSKYE